MLRAASKIYSSHPLSKDIIGMHGEGDIVPLVERMDIFINAANDKQLMLSGDKESSETELNRLLGIVSKKGLKALDLTELDLLRALLEAKSYADKKSNKSKEKLLKQINSAVYDSHNRHRLF
jgi:hypothetical protein